MASSWQVTVSNGVQPGNPPREPESPFQSQNREVVSTPVHPRAMFAAGGRRFEPGTLHSGSSCQPPMFVVSLDNEKRRTDVLERLWERSGGRDGHGGDRSRRGSVPPLRSRLLTGTTAR